MKLHRFEPREACQFVLTFENGEVREVDLKGLIGQHVPLDSLHTARIDQEWGCLVFLDSCVGIEPKTLYRYACAAEDKPAV